MTGRLPLAFYTDTLPRLLWLALFAIFALVLTVRHLATRPQRLALRRRRMGERGEVQAVALLRRAGYAVVAAQHPGSFTALVDGEPVRFSLRADYLVRRWDGRLLLAEVKTGEVAPELTHGPTRRQLLEYTLAYGDEVEGVLLVVPERGEITCVSFPQVMRASTPEGAPGWLISAVLGGGVALAGEALLRHLGR